MGFNINELKTDEDLSIEGVWCDYEEGLKLKVAHNNNRKAKKLRRKLQKKSRHALANFDLAKGEEINIEVTARTILLDWENMEEEVDGKLVPVPYSVEKAKEYLAIDAFMDVVTAFASDNELFQLESEEEDEGN